MASPSPSGSPPTRGFKRPTMARTRTTIQLIFSVMAGGLLSAAVVVFFMGRVVEPIEGLKMEWLLIGGGLISLCAIGLALALTRYPLHSQPINKQIQGYVLTRIMLAGALEGSGLLWTVTALIMAEPVYLMGSLCSVLVMLMFFPTHGRIEEAIGKTEAQIDRELDSLAA